jgi:hypothetical protein
MAERVALYALRIMGPHIGDDQTSEEYDRQNQAVVDEIGARLNTAEQLINESLPEGYYAKIEDA